MKTKMMNKRRRTEREEEKKKKERTSQVMALLLLPLLLLLRRNHKKRATLLVHGTNLLHSHSCYATKYHFELGSQHCPLTCGGRGRYARCSCLTNGEWCLSLLAGTSAERGKLSMVSLGGEC